MASVNKVILIGHLGRDPEIRYMPTGDAVATVSMATSESWKDKNGEKKESTEWHRIVAYGKVAEIIDEYLKKGAQAYFEGKLVTKKWTDKQGQERTTTEIVAHTLVMLGKSEGKPAESAPATEKPAATTKQSYAEASGASTRRAPAAKAGSVEDLEDDIPFVTASLANDVTMRKLWWPQR